MNIFPAIDEFKSLSSKYRIIPVCIDIPADIETPVSLYYKLVGKDRGFMLESADRWTAAGRYSYIGVEPFLTVTLYKDHAELDFDVQKDSISAAPVDALKQVMGMFSVAPLDKLPPFGGGAVGYLSYEAVTTWERVRGLNVPDDTILGEYMFCRTLVAVDHLTHSAKLIYLAQPDPDKGVQNEYEAVKEKVGQILAKINQAVKIDSIGRQFNIRAAKSADSQQDKKAFLASVAKAKEYIEAGDIFQVVLSQAFKRKLNTEPFVLYRRLRQVNPSPYMFYIDFGVRRLIGASPEMLVKLEDGKVSTCPIAGTRPRGKTKHEDDMYVAELAADIKENAEHAMLVDLGRNDLGRISRPGSVQVTKMKQIEKFSHVMHLVSEVTGLLEQNYSAVDALAACFPAGTVSGAPKVRAMEIIGELEQKSRGIYAGAVGYFDFRGNMNTCITIRTMVCERDEVTVQTGAGIVADSVPEKEYAEILSKAAVMFQVLEEGEEV